MPPRSPDEDETPRVAPLSQKQEDLLIELFIQLAVSDRKKVIKLCRDLQRAAKKREK